MRRPQTDGLPRPRGSARLSGAGRRAVRLPGRAARTTAGRMRRLSHAHGAGETGLGRLIELHAVNAAGDTLIAISLAGTLFFSVPTGEARGRVALYLLLTMAPFALVAPVIGPFLDRFRRGRRWAVGATLAARGFLCWVMAGAVATEAWWLYPAAFGCLVSSKAYGVTRASAVPRLLPEGVSLVTANSRISIFGVLGATVAAPLGVAAAQLGPQWSLRLAFAVFAVGAVLAGLLPARVDSSAGEEDASVLSRSPPEQDRRRHGLLSGRGVGPQVVGALRANAALRAFSGFLLMFLAFLLRTDPIGGLAGTAALGVAAGCAGAGSALGTGLGAVLRLRRPEVIGLVLPGVVAAVAATTALAYGLPAVVAVALAAGLAQQLGKLALDALIQRDVPESVRTSAFARSETLLQLSWVLGGGVGIALPLVPALGFGLAAAALLLGLAGAVRAGSGARRPAAAPAG